MAWQPLLIRVPPLGIGKDIAAQYCFNLGPRARARVIIVKGPRFLLTIDQTRRRHRPLTLSPPES